REDDPGGARQILEAEGFYADGAAMRQTVQNRADHIDGIGRSQAKGRAISPAPRANLGRSHLGFGRSLSVVGKAFPVCDPPSCAAAAQDVRDRAALSEAAHGESFIRTGCRSCESRLSRRCLTRRTAGVVSQEQGLRARSLARLSLERNRSSDRNSRQIKKLERVLIAKIYQLLRKLALPPYDASCFRVF